MQNNKLIGAMFLFACATFVLGVTIYANISSKPKQTTQKQQLLNCIESTEGTDAECDSCFYIVHHVKPNQ